MYKKQLTIFLIYYMLLYMTASTYGSFISVYYLSKGFSIVQIGILQAIAPILSIFTQPCWAYLSDNVKNRLTVLKVVYAGCFCAVNLYPFVSGFYQTVILTVCYMVFNTAIFPLSDAMTVDNLTRTGMKFNTVRMGGTLGFAVIVVICGNFFKDHIGSMFYINAAFLFVSFCFTFMLPVSEAQLVKSSRAKVAVIFQNKKLVFILVFIFFISIASSFNSAFLSVHIKQLHYGNNFVGIAMGVSALSEVPILILIVRYIRKFGTVNILLFSGLMMSLRMFICFAASNFEVILLAQLLQGLTYMTIHYSTITFINDEVPQTLKSTGQSLLAISQSGLGSITGTVGGGLVSSRLGIPSTYLLLSILLCFATSVLIAMKFFRSKRKLLMILPKE